VSTSAPVPTLSVTVVLYNSQDELPACLASVRADIDTGFAELIAVDNASPDRSAEIVRDAVPSARLVSSPDNRGFAGGANLAWPHVRGRYWFLLNPDSVLPSGTLRALVAWMDERPDIAVGSPALANAEGTVVWPSAQALPSTALVWLELLRLHRLLPRRSRAQLLQGGFWTYGDQPRAGWVPGTAMIVRRSAVDHVGLLDERFFMYAEDVDWCWRMHDAGWGVGSCSTVAVRHVGSASSDRSFGREEALLRTAQALVEVIRKRRGALRARVYAASMAIFLGLDSINLRRPQDQRDRSRAVGRAWWASALGRRPERFAAYDSD